MSHLPIDADPDNRSGALTSLASLGVFLPTFLPTNFGLQGTAATARPVLRIVKAVLSGSWR
jgi:hypothetical protein